MESYLHQPGQPGPVRPRGSFVHWTEDEAGVLADLRSEAQQLPEAEEAPEGVATTTLLVCPGVPAWGSFADFDAFYRERLAGGYALAARGLYIVPFHPRYGDSAPAEGEVIELMGEGPEEGAARARVLDAKAGFGAQGERLARVALLADGSEQLICLPPALGAAAVASRAPRPMLHLLRMADLERAHADPELRERNLRTAEELGEEGAERLLRSCG